MKRALTYPASRYILVALSTIIGAAIFSVTASADTYDDSLIARCAADGEISANEAKRIVRQFLTERGFSSQMRPGGARIGKVVLEDRIWAIDIKLYGDSLANRRDSTVFIDTRSGLLAENRPEPGPFLAGVPGQ